MALANHGNSLVASTVTTVTLTSNAATSVDNLESLLVTNVTGTAKIYFTYDGTTPTVGGSNTLFVPASANAAKGVELGGRESVTVKLISSGTPEFAVEASS